MYISSIHSCLHSFLGETATSDCQLFVTGGDRDQFVEDWGAEIQNERAGLHGRVRRRRICSSNGRYSSLKPEFSFSLTVQDIIFQSGQCRLQRRQSLDRLSELGGLLRMRGNRIASSEAAMFPYILFLVYQGMLRSGRKLSAMSSKDRPEGDRKSDVSGSRRKVTETAEKTLRPSKPFFQENETLQEGPTHHSHSYCHSPA
ncbi:hypothetical protein RvY_10198-2 [Ramazzottius varieornatus]|uniref:Uncharacterized protein n=1 Tax=Ramazzottius varieornatus TaxID=947166 RepID=A0A1D1VE30_RAMVA|nr:hypothetical protein RvY_10198-2 [Ramazzottius varieornatus]